MPMQMGFRWYGEGNDKIKLSDIKQIPGVTSIVWALHHKMPGEIWEEEEIAEDKRQLDEYGFCIDVMIILLLAEVLHRLNILSIEED